MAPLQNASTFLISVLFDVYIFILLLRLIFQYLRVDYYNPISQFIVKVTQPVVTPLRRFIPGFWGIDFATVTAILGINFLKILLIIFATGARFPSIFGLFVVTIGSIIALTIKLFFYAVLVRILLSWFAPQSRSAGMVLLYQLTEPLLRPARRLIPPIGGFDISPIPVLILLQFLMILTAGFF